MYSHHEISINEHRAWFRRMQQDPRRRWYLFQDETTTAQGVVYLPRRAAQRRSHSSTA